MANSLAEFYQSLRARNAGRSLYAPVAQSVMAADVTDPYGSIGSNFANNLAKGLLAGGATQLFRQEQAQYDKDLTAGLRATLGGASAFKTALPEDDLAALSAFKLARDVEQADTIQKMQQEITMSGLKAQAEEGGKLKGQLGIARDLSSLGSGVAEEDLAKVNPIIGAKVEQRNKLDALEREYTDKLLTGPAAREVLNINKAATNILEAVKKDSPLAASTAIFEFAKLQDPIGTVREGDELRVADPGGPLGKLAQMHNEMLQKGKLTPDAKKAMKELIPIMQNNMFSQYNQVKQGFLDSAKSYNANPDRIQYVKPVDLSAYLQPDPAEIKSEYKALVSQLGNAELAKQQIKQKYGGF